VTFFRRHSVDMRVMTACPCGSVGWRTRHHVYHMLLHPIVNVDNPEYLIMGPIYTFNTVHIGLTFAQLSAIVIFMKFIYACKWANTIC